MGKYKILHRFDLNNINGINPNLIWATNEFKGGAVSAPPPPAARDIDVINLKAAYSLSLLQGGYTGDAEKVRRDSNQDHLDIGFSGAGLDETALTDFCASTNGFGAEWYDQSGNGFDVTQSTTSLQPQIVNNGDIIKTGSPLKPTNQFDGDRLLNSSLTISPGNVYSIFLVFRIDGVNTGGCVYGTTNITYNGFFPRFTDGNCYLPESDSGYVPPIASPFTGNTDYLVSIFYNGTTVNGYINGSSTPFISSSSVGTITFDNLSVGYRILSASDFTGKISEILLYDANKFANKATIETNINDYYSLY